MPVAINWLAVIVAAVASMVVGMIWYNPKVFGHTWMKLAGITHKQAKKQKEKGMGKSMILAFISEVVLAAVLSFFIKSLGAVTVGQGVTIGIVAWLGFVATFSLGTVLWEGKSMNLYFLTNAHNVVTIIVMSIILTVWV